MKSSAFRIKFRHSSNNICYLRISYSAIKINQLLLSASNCCSCFFSLHRFINLNDSKPAFEIFVASESANYNIFNIAKTAATTYVNLPCCRVCECVSCKGTVFSVENSQHHQNTGSKKRFQRRQRKYDGKNGLQSNIFYFFLFAKIQFLFSKK